MPVAARLPASAENPGGTLVVDAGVEHIRFREVAADGRILADDLVANHGDLRKLVTARGLNTRFGHGQAARSPLAAARPGSPDPEAGDRVVVTGKLAGTAVSAIGAGRAVSGQPRA